VTRAPGRPPRRRVASIRSISPPPQDPRTKREALTPNQIVETAEDNQGCRHGQHGEKEPAADQEQEEEEPAADQDAELERHHPFAPPLQCVLEHACFSVPQVTARCQASSVLAQCGAPIAEHRFQGCAGAGFRRGSVAIPVPRPRGSPRGRNNSLWRWNCLQAPRGLARLGEKPGTGEGAIAGMARETFARAPLVALGCGLVAGLGALHSARRVFVLGVALMPVHVIACMVILLLAARQGEGPPIGTRVSGRASCATSSWSSRTVIGASWARFCRWSATRGEVAGGEL
jgi:hypothetical protein